MKNIFELTREEKLERISELEKTYQDYMSQNLKLDMSRGKPAPAQLDISLKLLDNVNERSGFLAGAVDVRNYGLLDGISEMKDIFAEIFEVDKAQVIVGGNSSLKMMYDFIAMAYIQGLRGHQPWHKQGTIKFLCPSPGYDRHFAISENFGFELIQVDMLEDGPDMARVEELVKDPQVKGIWNVPKYSNPTGITYSAKVVKDFASLKPAAPDFSIIWDNAYCLHDIDEEADVLDNLYYEAEKRGNADMVFMFTSTSKMSFPGSGVAAMAASPANIAQMLKAMSFQTIGYDKINMLRHIRFFKNVDGIKMHMKLHAAMLKPKFDVVLTCLDKQLSGLGIAKWTKPSGGYFICVDLLEGCAKETVRLLSEAGVVMTCAGATHPYGIDPKDSSIRVAPTFPDTPELKIAMALFCICAELACLKKVLD